MSTSSSTTEAARVRASAPDMEAPAAANRSSFDHAVTYIAGSSAVGVAGAFMGLVFRGAIMKVSSLAIATLGAYGIIATMACYVRNMNDIEAFKDQINKYLILAAGVALAGMLLSDTLFFAIIWGGVIF